MDTTPTVRCTLARLMQEKSKRDGVTLTKYRLQKDTGLAAGTIQRYFEGKQGYYDSDTLGILCKYFQCQIGDLLEYVEEAPKPEDLNPLQ
jgi:putative transcriptional regulator